MYTMILFYRYQNSLSHVMSFNDNFLSPHEASAKLSITANSSNRQIIRVAKTHKYLINVLVSFICDGYTHL